MVEASDTALPRFTYHPDPLATGSFVLSSTECLACAKSRGWIYVGPTYCEAELDDHLCRRALRMERLIASLEWSLWTR